MRATPAPWLVAALLGVAVLVAPRRPRDTGAPARGLRAVPGWRSRRKTPPEPPRDLQTVASALVLLALAYRSGLPSWQVLEAVAAQSPEGVSTDLRQVGAALRWGADEQQAWGSVDAAWAPAARAISIAHRAGLPPATLLMTASDDLRRADLERLEVVAAQVGVRLVLPLGLVLLPAFCLTTVVPLVVAIGRNLLGA